MPIEACGAVLLLAHETSAHYFRVMKNITLSADENLIEMARAEARKRKTSLNALFREWLEEFAKREEHLRRADEVIWRMSDFDSGGTFHEGGNE